MTIIVNLTKLTKYSKRQNIFYKIRTDRILHLASQHHKNQEHFIKPTKKYFNANYSQNMLNNNNN
jgi:hypothetical protein